MSTDLPKGHTVLSLDPRPIKSIRFPFGNRLAYGVGVEGCTRIEAYDENGGMASVPWLAVFKGDEVSVRLSADHVTVQYA